MHFKHTLVLACASLALLASAAPQAAGSASKSTLTRTVIATATIGGANPAATGMAAETGVLGGADGAANAADVDSAASTGTDVGAGTADSSTGSNAGAAPGPKSAADSGSGSSGVGAGAQGTPSGSASSNMAPVGGSSDAGRETGTRGGPGDVGGNVPPMGGFKGSFDDRDFPEEFRGKGPGGDKGQFWTKFAGSTGHPHQLMARRWSNWFGAKGDKGVMGGEEKISHVHARDNVVAGGPSWNHVRTGAVAKLKVARGMPMGEQGQGGQYEGGMGYDGKLQGGSRGKTYGQ